jgi:cytochrome c553
VRRTTPAVFVCGLLATAGISWSFSAASAEPTSLNLVQSTYLERCGGCHGIQGLSSPGEVPTLRGQVGYFLCTPQARAYLVRLPSLAASPLSDRDLADLLNFVVFDLGGARETGGSSRKFTEAEVGALRTRPLKDVALARYRAGLVEELISGCAAPASLRQYSSVQGR